MSEKRKLLADVESGKELDSFLFNGNKTKAIILPCLACKTQWIYDVNSLTGQGVFNCFCNSECEDKFAFRQ